MQWGRPLDLNRLSLRKLRELRERLVKCAPLVSASVLELRKFKLDQLPPSLRGLALIAIRKAEAAQKQFAEDIDSLLRNFARSELIDPDPDVGERAEERAVELENSKLSFRGLGEVRGKIALAKNSEDQPGCSTLLAPRPEPRASG
jgi:hypothetical protein